MKKVIISTILLSIQLITNAQTKIGFNINDAFTVSNNSVAHYGMSQISGSGYQYIGLSGYFGLNFYTDGKERIKVLRNGNVGIGTTNPNAKLKVNGDIAALNKIGFNTHDAFKIENNSVAHYGISRISGSGYQDIALSGYFGLNFYTDGKERIKVLRNGNIGIGTTETKGYKLGVKGKIAAEEVKVALHSKWADFVFYKNYKLPSLTEVEQHIKEKGHLKNIPSAKEVKENGILLGEMNTKLLQKIEELTLYTIQQEKKIKNLESLNNKLIELQSRLEKLESKKQ